MVLTAVLLKKQIFYDVVRSVSKLVTDINSLRTNQLSKDLTEDEDLRENTSRCSSVSLAIPASDRIPGLSNRHLKL